MSQRADDGQYGPISARAHVRKAISGEPQGPDDPSVRLSRGQFDGGRDKSPSGRNALASPGRTGDWLLPY